MNHFHVNHIHSFQPQPIMSLNQTATKSINASLSTNESKMKQFCFQLTAGANYSGFALGDAILCRHWDRFGLLKAGDSVNTRDSLCEHLSGLRLRIFFVFVSL